MNQDLITKLLRPKSLAVIGASATPGKIGYKVVENLIQSGYSPFYPINPTVPEILGVKCYPSISAVPGSVEAAVITVPAKAVLDVTIECGKKGVKGLIIITSGFSEVGDKELEDRIVDAAHQYGMCILGPNIVGTLSNADKMNASFAPELPLEGKASLVTQSGALLIAIDGASYVRRVGFEKLISIGNMADVNFADLIEWLDNDKSTECIALHIEGLKEGRRFIQAGRKAKKPVIVLKAGVSEHGAAAAASHTGSLAGATKIYNAAFRQAGMIQTSDLGDLFDVTLTLSQQPKMKGDNLLLTTNGGGVGVLATDAAEHYGVPLKFVPKDVQEEFKKYMPDFGSAKNPVDMTGMANNDWYYATTKFAISHAWVNALTVLYCETAITNPIEIAQNIHKAVLDSGVKDKPVTASFVGGKRCDEAICWLIDHGIPAFGAPDNAVRAISALREYATISENCKDEFIPYKDVKKDQALQVIASARKDGRNALTEIEAKEVFAAYGLPVTQTNLAKSEEEAVKLAAKVGYPIVMKIVSPEIIHKSDAGGVKVNIKDEAGVREAYKTILANAKKYKQDANIHGIAIQEMAAWGTEVIIGSVNDPTFEATVMFGLGGIFVEVLKDVTFRVAPITKDEATEMLGEIRGAPILAGARGEAPRDRKALADLLSRYSQMIEDLKGEVAESDANPVLVYEDGKGIKVVDARIILKKK